MNKGISEGRTAVFIDGANSYATTKQLGFAVDFNKLRGWLDDGYAPVTRINYYTAVHEDDNEHQTMRPLLDWLEYNGYNVVTKKNRVYEFEGRQRTKNSIDIEMAVDIVLASEWAHNIVVFSGDANIVRPVKVAQANGCHVTVVSSKATKPQAISDELRRCADLFIDYADLGDVLTEKKTRPTLVGA